MKHLLTILLFTSSAIAMDTEVVKQPEAQEVLPAPPKQNNKPPVAKDKQEEELPLPLAQNDQAHASRLFVRNTAEHPLLIKYTKNGIELRRVVRSTTTLYICPPVLLSSVKVFLHGKYKGKSNIETLSMGLLSQQDLAGKILSRVIKETPVDIYLEVSLPKGLKGAVSSFGFDVNSQPTDNNLALPETLEYVFPHAHSLINKGSVLLSITGYDFIALRHFLNVPEDASRIRRWAG